MDALSTSSTEHKEEQEKTQSMLSGESKVYDYEQALAATADAADRSMKNPFDRGFCMP